MIGCYVEANPAHSYGGLHLTRQPPAAGYLLVALAAGLAGAVAIFVTEGTLGPFGWLGGPNATMWPELLSAGAFGGYVAARRQWLAAEQDRAVRVAQMREEETRRRVDAERMRIARELHDVVAHSMAMINVQATTAGMLLAEDPAGAAAAIQTPSGWSPAAMPCCRLASPAG